MGIEGDIRFCGTSLPSASGVDARDKDSELACTPPGGLSKWGGRSIPTRFGTLLELGAGGASLRRVTSG